MPPTESQSSGALAAGSGSSHVHHAEPTVVGFVGGAETADSNDKYGERHRGPLQGWLLKKHEHERLFQRNWAHRYFSISQEYGTLSYSKAEGKGANIMLPLCDVSRIERHDIEEHGPFCFTVVCPPAHLTLKAADGAECELWMRALAHHAAVWKVKSSRGVPLREP